MDEHLLHWLEARQRLIAYRCPDSTAARTRIRVFPRDQLARRSLLIALFGLLLIHLAHLLNTEGEPPWPTSFSTSPKAGSAPTATSPQPTTP